MLSHFMLSGKTIIVTGASSGIGRECAICCSKHNATVILLGRDIERLSETLSMMQNAEKHFIYTIDLLEYEKVVAITRNIVTDIGKIDGLVNCAGISTTLPLNSISPLKMELFFKTNVIGALNLTKQVVKASHFSEDGGSIVFISSVMGRVGEAGKSLYGMTKGAIDAAVKSLAVELAPRKLRVNSILPGVVESPMSKNAVYSRDTVSLSKIINLHPLGLGKPEDIANAGIFLLSDASRWITGTNLIVDGGYLAK